jgi:hypothetical protein
MKEFTRIVFDPVRCRQELVALRTLLESVPDPHFATPLREGG